MRDGQVDFPFLVEYLEKMRDFGREGCDTRLTVINIIGGREGVFCDIQGDVFEHVRSDALHMDRGAAGNMDTTVAMLALDDDRSSEPRREMRDKR